MKSKKFPVGTGGGRHPERIALKRQDASDRNQLWRSLGPKKQLACLDDRLGAGVGAKRQRERIARSA